MNNGWTTLGNLKPGAIFETHDGKRAVNAGWHDVHGLRVVALEDGLTYWYANTYAVRELDLVGRSMDPPDAGESQDPFGIGFNADHRQGWTDCQERLRRKP